jgi:poly(3-hydroxybutyrate) depolymerase
VIVDAHSRPGNALVIAAWFIAASGSGAARQGLERGTIVDRVQGAGDPGQTYALSLPSTYSPERKWSLILAFHPAARGRLMVEKFQAAAETYGYIIAASNNSRNGPYAFSQAAAQAMSTDVSRRFNIDPKRVYLAGMSGGARVATGIALGKNNIAVRSLRAQGIPTASRGPACRSPSSARLVPRTSTTWRWGCSIAS